MLTLESGAKPTLTVAAPHRDPRVRRMQKKSPTKFSPVRRPSTPEAKSNTDSLSCGKVPLTETSHLNLDKQRDIEPLKNNSALGEFGTAQNFDFTLDDESSLKATLASLPSFTTTLSSESTLAQERTTTSVAAAQLELVPDGKTKSPSIQTDIANNDGRLGNGELSASTQQGGNEMKLSNKILSETVASKTDEIGMTTTVTESASSSFMSSSDHVMKDNALVVGKVTDLEDIPGCSLVKSGKTVSSSGTSGRSIMELPLPPGEELKDYNNRGHLVQGSDRLSKRKDSNEEPEHLSEDLVDHIVKTAPLTLKKV